MYSGDDYYGDDVTSPTERPYNAYVPTIARTAEALRGVRATGSEADVNRFLCAIERRYGSAHMRAAHRLAGEIALRARPLPMDGTDYHVFGEA